ncbi:extracellular calcium-sensing receptor-like [Rhinatrema bivittatum]|uniref:extracellular calcium-sensing receptor-like n=1 Tax=Rhinatrema bivittatum TaxID=194408 RepID=UPI001128A19D|nr:extracellular calcium-sensing receptor-like [Rhinatrema bivittatum]
MLPTLLVFLVLPARLCPVDAQGCTLKSLEEVVSRSDGDIIIGGTFPINYNWRDPEMVFTKPPEPILCNTFASRTYQWAQAMAFTISEINRDQNFFPNLTLGFLVYDTCLSLVRILKGTMRMLTGQAKPIANYQCQSQPSLAAFVADSGSTRSIATARLLGLYRYPQVSYFASSPLLSEKIQFPSFCRTIPSDDIQAWGLAQLVAHFEWSWVGLLSSEDDYGELGSQMLKSKLQKFGICIAFHETFSIVPTARKIIHIVDTVKRTSANAILVFSADPFMRPVMEELSKHNITGKVWLASEAWSTSPGVSTNKLASMLSGTIGFAIHESKIPGFEEFLLKLHPLNSPNDIFVKMFWEMAFRCRWPNSKINQTLVNLDANSSGDFCTGAEQLENLKSPNSNETDLRISLNIYNAVYSVAHALQDMNSCVPGKGPFANNTCANFQHFKPWQLLHYMKKVHFRNKMGEEMYFDRDGNPPAMYDIVNWHLQPDGTISYVNVGKFDSRAPKGEELYVNISAIQWNTQRTEIPRSVCSENCPPGYRKASQKGRPLCCFDCVLCAEGEVSNVTDSSTCWPCPSDQWPNQRRSKCTPKRKEFLSYQEPLGSTLAAIVVLWTIITILILCTFIKYRDTPIAKANNRALSFLLLGTLVLSFLCSLLFIGDPHPTTCLIRQTAFGITFVLCISCVLAKTIMVIIAFNATKPNSNFRGWLGPWVTIVLVSTSTFLQVFICTTWLLICPPFPEKNMKLKIGIIIWQCNECTDVAFWCMLGYMGLLACVSFLVAFLARKLPDSFNEAKWITFSMLVFLSVWLSFIPGYLSTQGKYTVAVEVFGIISSSAGILVCIFFPKCYIILLRPDMNTRQQLFGKGARKNKKIKTI